MFGVSRVAIYPPLDNRFRVGGVCAARGSQLITQVVTRLYSLCTVTVQKFIIFYFLKNNGCFKGSLTRVPGPLSNPLELFRIFHIFAEVIASEYLLAVTTTPAIKKIFEP